MKVSIIIPYNKDRGWLREAVKSAMNQDGFTLGEDYELIPQEGKFKLGKNYNDALKKARGDFIKGLAEDDMLDPKCLQILYPFAVENELDFACANAISLVNGHHSGIQKSWMPETVDELAHGNTFHGGTILYRRSKLPEWNEKMWTGEEAEISLRMAAAGCKFGYIDKEVYWYRAHGQQKSEKYMHTKGKEREAYMIKWKSAFYGNMSKIWT
jgi:glycosyltransferase involved in cell wall biosynthesis